ncbi:MAG: InlB B-repeat-containing protein [Salinivirgaceae bacterium]|nr:InlB B-repeat-containing protein [Salinivirgaceae bacterium]
MSSILKKMMAAFCLTMAIMATAEAQNSFAYQAVIRSAKGDLVSNQEVGMLFSLIYDGKVVYSETHKTKTNQYGNVQVEVGKGQTVSGTFAEVPWSTMQVMMKIEADPDGGTNYIDLGTIQLQPAPYAMYAPAAGKVSTIQAGDPKSDSDALFEVRDKDGNVVFAVYHDGVRVFVNDTDSAKALSTGFAVAGRRAAKEDADADIFAVNAKGTQVFVNDKDTAGGKAMQTGFAVSGRKAASKDGFDLFTVGATGTQVYIDEDATKAVRTGFAVAGRRAGAKGDSDKYLEINADGTRVYVEDDSTKAVRTGFAVSGRRAAKSSSNGKFLEINADGTKIYVDENGKAVSTGFAVSGRRAAKGKEIRLFEVNSYGTQIYIDSQKDKAVSTGFAVSGRRAAKNDSGADNTIKYMVIDAEGTVIYVDYEEAKAMRTGFAVSGRKAAKDGTPNTIFKVDNVEGTRAYIEDNEGKAMQTGFAVSGRRAVKDNEPDLMRITIGNTSFNTSEFELQDKESDKSLVEITSQSTTFSTPEFSVTDHNDSTLLSADTSGVGVHTELVVTGDVAQVEEFNEVEEIQPIQLLVQKIDTIRIADSVPALYNANGYELLKMYGNGLFAANKAVDVEGNKVIMFNANGNPTTTQSSASAVVLMQGSSTPDAKLIIWPLKQANNLKISFGLMAAGDTTNRYVNVDVYVNTAGPVECKVAVKSEVDSLGTVRFSGPKVYGAKLDLIPTPIEGYHFTKWSDGRLSNPRTVLILHDTAYSSANFEINTYNISATGEHGTVTVEGNQNADSTYNHGTRLTLKTHADAHYHFLRWNDGDRSTPRQLIIKRDTAFEAVFAIDSFPVTAEAENGKVTGTGIYAYNSEIELTAVADQFHHFLNWSDGSTDNPLKLTVDDEINLTAYFEIDSYMLTVDNPDEGEIEVKGNRNADWTYNHGTEIELTATAMEPHYHFDHWFDGSRSNPHKVTVTDEMTITAVFMLDSCTVSTTASEGGKAVGGGTVEYGTEIELRAYPDTAAGYHFTSWSDGDNTNPRKLKVKKDAQLVANFSLNTYTVAYIIDGDVYGEAEDVAYGTALTLRAAPVKEGYTFGGWSNAPATMPMHNVTITGTMPANKHTINYKVDGVDYQTVGNVEFGTRPRLIAAPEKEGYTFSGWQNVPATMPDKDITIEGTFDINRYTIAFNTNNGSAVDTITANYGAAIALPAAPTREGYTFDGWDKQLPATMPAQNLTLRAKWILNKYTITFDTDGGAAMAAMTVNYSKPVSEPAEPRKKGYTFIGWDTQIPAKMPATNLTIKALWKVNQYTISFDADGGSPVASITADYGTAITVPAAPEKLGYRFDGWDSELPATMPAENLTLKAHWTQRLYTLSVETQNGSVSGIGEYTYGQNVTLTANPNEHYHFVNWNGGLTSKTVSFTVKNDTLLTANFAIDEYAISFVSEGKTLQSGNIAYGETPEYKGETPTKAATAQYAYTHTGWTPAIEPVTGEKTYTAVFTENERSYTIKFVNDDNTELYSTTVKYGEMPEYDGETPTKAATAQYAYTHTGWTPAIEPVTGEKTYTAVFTSTENQYAVNFGVNDNAGGTIRTNAASQTIASGDKVNYGTSVIITAEPSYGYYYLGLTNGKGEIVSNQFSIVKDTTLTAVFMKDFEGTDSLKYTLTSATTVSVRAGQYPPARKWIDIPETVTRDGFTFNVTEIEENAFSFYTSNNITAVIVPEGVTTIGANAFGSCERLTQISLPSTLVNLGSYAFQSCPALTTVTVADGNTAYCVVDGVLYNKDKTTLVVYPAAKSGTSFTIPTSVTHIDKCAFRNCQNLTSVTYAGNNVTIIDESAFYNCKFSNVSIPASVVTIGNSAFSKCTMAEVTIPAGVQNIGYAAFTDCSNLTEITVAYGNRRYSSVDGVLFSYNRDTLVQYPAGKTAESYTVADGVKVVSSQAFNGCSKLKSLTIAGDVERIEDYVIANCTNLRTVAIGNKVVSIGMSMFSFCQNLTTVTIPGKVTHIGTEGGKAFALCGNVTAYCEADSKPENWYFDKNFNVSNVKYGCKYIKASTSDASKGSVTVDRTNLAVEGADGSLWYEKGKTATFTASPADYYHFVNWNGNDNLTNETYSFTVEDNTSLTANFAINNHTITYMVDGAVSGQVETYNYGETITLRTKPSKEGYTFAGWSDGQTTYNENSSFSIADSDVTFTAQWTVNKYEIKFVNYDGTELQKTDVAYGTTPVYDGTTPTKPADAQYTYTFSGWSPAIATVTGAATYTAQFSSTTRKYTITFKNGETTLQSTEVAYGQTPNYNGDTPTKTADAQYTYTFSSWSPAIATVTGAATYTAQFSTTTRQYTITFGVATAGTGSVTAKVSGTAISSGASVNYGSDVVLTAVAGSGYTFSHWNDGNTSNPRTVNVKGNCDYKATFTTGSTTTISLSGLTENTTVSDGSTLTGTTNYKITIADGASVTLNDATINKGIVCAGSATINLVGTNKAQGYDEGDAGYAGVQCGGVGTTLTIKGDGSLTAIGGHNSAGIGLRSEYSSQGGDIVIEGGNIFAQGGTNADQVCGAAGIGACLLFNNGSEYALGSITIKGGSVTAIGGNNVGGLGKGTDRISLAIGPITIYSGIDMVDASGINNGITIKYMNGQTDVTSNTSSYFTIVSDGNRRFIIPKENTNYSVSIASNISGGSVTADKTTAKAGDIVNLTATAASGYRLISLTVKDLNDRDVTVNNNHFIMPKSGVIVSATFVESTAVLNNGELTLSGNVKVEDVQAFKDENVTSVICESGTVFPEDCFDMFSGFRYVATIDLSNANVSYVTRTQEMFESCYQLRTIYVSSSWSLSRVSGSFMFIGCNQLRGGNGTEYNSSHIDAEYARIDGQGGPGYLTEK